MTIHIPNHFILEYTGYVTHKLQYEGSKLRAHVVEGMHRGEGSRIIDYFGPIEMVEVTSRFSPKPRMDAEADSVWVYPYSYQVSQLIDNIDKLKLMTDPQSSLVESAAKAMGRQIDRLLFGRFFAPMNTGKSGQVIEQFNNADVDAGGHRVPVDIGGAGPTGMTVSKILRGIRALEDQEIDVESEMPCIAITPKQHEELLNDTRATSLDYVGRPVIGGDGRIRQLAGCQIKVSTMVQKEGANLLNPMWVKSGMHLGIWDEKTKSEVKERVDLETHPVDLYNMMTVGATRTEAGKVIQIECVA